MAVRLPRPLFLFLVLALTASALSARPPQSAIPAWIAVKSTQGGPVPSAVVTVVASLGAPIDHLTDDNGLAQLPLRPGPYFLIVKGVGFVTLIRHLDLQPGDAQDVELLLDPLVSLPDVPSVTPVVAFPQRTHAVSPDKRWDLSQTDRDDFTAHHAIYLQDLEHRDRDARRLLQYEDRIDLAWNSTSDLIAVTDYAAGDDRRCRVLAPFDKKLVEIPALAEVQSALPSAGRNNFNQAIASHHLQLLSCTWSGPRQVRLEFLGYRDGDPAGFRNFYTWNVP